MSGSIDRRSFVTRLAKAGLLAPVAGCVDAGPPRAGAEDGASVSPLGRPRPVLLPWREGAYRILSPLDELPMAYVSMARREVFVDFAYRDRSNWLLDAHISVSTGVWRIPLPGDPVGEPVTPGDTLREFEELDISRWDPTMAPEVGDFRIRRGEPFDVRVAFECTPVGATEDWVAAGPFTVQQCDGVADLACREDFGLIGVGRRHRVRGCGTDDGEVVDLLSWACPPQG